MAGGKGERFWPRSRRSLPKQFLRVTSETKTMIGETLERTLLAADPANVFISLREDLLPAARQCLPDFPLDQYIVEPVGRDTAAAMGLASVVVERRRPGTVLAILPSDHLVAPAAVFAEDLKSACRVAQEYDCLVTFGVRPERPETGFGYIELGEVIHTRDRANAYEVRRFTEKPDRATAEKYLKTGNFCWNSGMFVWKPSVFLGELEKFLPDHYHGLREIQEWADDPGFCEKARPVFERLEKISVDFGVMEKARNILCLRANFGWDDVGHWTALERVYPKAADGGTVKGPVVLSDVKNSMVLNFDDASVVAVMGLKDVVVVKTADAVLVCDRRSDEEMKKLLRLISDRDDLKKFL
jgi:mannose-1-phosphate guanylyltransferase